MIARANILIKCITAIVMIAALLLLVSGNYWAYGFKKQQQQSTASTTGDEEQDNAPPVPNPTEEKTSTGLQTISEYLHNHSYTIEHPVALIYTGYHTGFERLPVYHPELLTPPPKQS